jgi:hypothetical protein
MYASSMKGRSPDVDRFFTVSVHVPYTGTATLTERHMESHTKKVRSLHRHKAVVAHALRQHAGIPYEVEQKVCSGCHRVLDERTLRRAAA